MSLGSSSTAFHPSGGLSSASGTSVGEFVKAVLIVTAVAGTLDIVAAHIHTWIASGKFPVNLLKAIAGGALGRERAMQGGAGLLWLGLFFHFVISFLFTLFFFSVYPRVKWMGRNVFVTGVFYTLLVWTTMNVIVLPLSALNSPLPNFASKHTYIGVLVLAIVFTLPIMVGAERLYRKRSP